jgi:DNA-binding response OmpR family regulator
METEIKFGLTPVIIRNPDGVIFDGTLTELMDELNWNLETRDIEIARLRRALDEKCAALGVE